MVTCDKCSDEWTQVWLCATSVQMNGRRCGYVRQGARGRTSFNLGK